MINAHQLAARVPLFANLAADDLRDLLRVMQHHTFGAGQSLLRLGQPADSALFVEAGRANAIVPLPGGGEAVLAEFGPGSVLGEIALLEEGVRVAHVIASEPTACFAMGRDAFRAVAAQGNRAARALLQRITLALCQRLRTLNGRILAASEPEALAPAVRSVGAERRAPGFDCRAFLPLLSAFQNFNADDLDALMRVVTAFDLPRGAQLFRAGEPGSACYIVVRGALEISREQQGLQRRIGILGPGRICGVLGLIEGEPHSMSAAAREATTLMEIPASVFHCYHSGDGLGTQGSLKFQSAVNHELLRSLARTNNHLTRLISQAHIRKRDDEAHALHCDLIAQECRAAG